MRDFIMGFILGVIGAIFATFLAHVVTAEHYQEEAIARGFAEYDGTTGQWQWMEEEAE